MQTYMERHEAFKAACNAAREALDSLERAEHDYYRQLVTPGQTRGYVRQQHESAAGMLKAKAIDEATEIVEHVSDALNTWWPIGRPSWSGRD